MAPQRPADTATCSISVLEPVLRTLGRLGIEAAGVLAKEGLTVAQLRDDERRIPLARYRGVIRAAAEASGDPAFGVRLVEDIEVERFSLWTYLAASSETGRRAYERATRYAGINIDNLDYELIVEGPRTICRTGVLGFERSRSETEFAVGMMVKLAPFIATDEPERAAWFRHPRPPYADQVEAAFGCAVLYEQRFDAIIGTSARLDAPLPRADSALCALLEEHAAGLLARVPQPTTFVDRVRERIGTLLPRGQASAERVAEELGLSPRTLRRRLADEGTGYQPLLDEVRLELACRTLREPGISVNEVAFLLGFSDASAFHKAFRRWTGQRPGDYARGIATGD
jgi:AraC-like DNA-binding protein